MTARQLYRIAVIPGDGIGQEVVPEADPVAREDGLELRRARHEVAPRAQVGVLADALAAPPSWLARL